MYASKYNLRIGLNNGSKHILINSLSGAVDIVDQKVLNVLDDIKKDGIAGPEYAELMNNLAKRKYIYDSVEKENEVVTQMNNRLQSEMASAPENFIISTTYTCNMKCKYCFQSSLPPDQPAVIDAPKIDKAFAFMSAIHKERGSKSNPLLTIYGGEPLQKGKAYKDAVERILNKARDNNYSVIVITNGANLTEYAEDFLGRYNNIKELHVTLDGSEHFQNNRRPLKDGSESFPKVVKGIDTALDRAIPVNLRFVADGDNVDALPGLVDFMFEKGWADMPHFKPHMGRICCGCPGEYTHNIMTTDQLVTKLLEFYKQSDRVKQIIPTRCMGLDQLCATGKPYPPVFAACPGAKMEYALDAYGNVYPCSASMGKEDFKIGTYYPNIEFNDKLNKWRGRSIFNSKECSGCSMSLYCGGGCPIEASLEKGSFEKSSCRPVMPTLRVGVEYFLPKLKEIAEKNSKSDEKDCC